MNVRSFSLVAGLALIVPVAHGQSFSAAESDLDYLYITPKAEGAEVVFSSPWLITVFSQSTDQLGTDVQTLSGTDATYSVSSAVYYAGGGADANGEYYDDPYAGAGGGASGDVEVFNASGTHFVTMQNTFQIAGDGETSLVDFCASVFNGAIALSGGSGYNASATATFNLFIGNSEVPLLNRTFSFSSSNGEFNEDDIEETLHACVPLNMNEDYNIQISMFTQVAADGDGSEPVPEPSSIFAASALGAMVLRRVVAAKKRA